jgi:SWI/SNF-related matrix-associated actin-dependent regulator of chromatin subfamily A member 5
MSTQLPYRIWSNFVSQEPGPPYTTDTHLNSGKMVIFDNSWLLWKQRANTCQYLVRWAAYWIYQRVIVFAGHAVHYFPCYYLTFRAHVNCIKYCHINGGAAHDDHISTIDEYNKPGGEKFIFLLTTHAGGLSINLTTANIVILYESDWYASNNWLRVSDTKVFHPVGI